MNAFVPWRNENAAVEVNGFGTCVMHFCAVNWRKCVWVSLNSNEKRMHFIQMLDFALHLLQQRHLNKRYILMNKKPINWSESLQFISLNLVWVEKMHINQMSYIAITASQRQHVHFTQPGIEMRNVIKNEFSWITYREFVSIQLNQGWVWHDSNAFFSRTVECENKETVRNHLLSVPVILVFLFGEEKK